ncbi:hypothetical protein FRC12_000596 [Ceratobasidium sp. 428]|nr:hypothetical protein FRC12_000596 [Ceratobasidium sp. 428]
MSKAPSNNAPMDIDSKNHDEPFRRWKIAQNDFSRALSDFQAASTDFCNALSTSIHSFSRSPLEQTLTALDLELPSLQAYEERLKTTRATLTIERNKSKVLNPIHSLPSEILATIFSVSIGQYTRYDRSRAIKFGHASPTTISGVCSLWRRIALETRSLWSHIDITVGGKWKPQFEHARLWSQRSRDLLLYIAVRDFPPGELHSRSGVQAYRIRALIEFLAPLMPRVRVLDVWLVADSHNMLLSIIGCWIENALQVPGKILQLRNVLHKHRPAIELSPDTIGSISPEAFNAFFDTVSRVSLLNCCFRGPVVFSAALVELHLEQLNEPYTPSQQDLAAMLATSPRLRILVLSDCCIQPSEGTPDPVVLNHLQSLSLEHIGEPGHSGFEYVFPLLDIGSETLDMSLTLDDDPDFVIEAESFFSRTRVTRLFVRDIGLSLSLSVLLFPMPYLQTLGIEGCSIS